MSYILHCSRASAAAVYQQNYLIGCQSIRADRQCSAGGLALTSLTHFSLSANELRHQRSQNKQAPGIWLLHGRRFQLSWADSKYAADLNIQLSRMLNIQINCISQDVMYSGDKKRPRASQETHSVDAILHINNDSYQSVHYKNSDLKKHFISRLRM